MPSINGVGEWVGLSFPLDGASGIEFLWVAKLRVETGMALGG